MPCGFWILLGARQAMTHERTASINMLLALLGTINLGIERLIRIRATGAPKVCTHRAAFGGYTRTLMAPSHCTSTPSPLRVAYVTMQFPSGTETFAGTDVHALRDQKVDVVVFAMRPAHPAADRLLRERGLDGLRVEALDTRNAWRGIAASFAHPRWTLALLEWIVRWQGTRPGTLVRCLALIPSALAIFARVAAERFDVVHLFWGNYPSMVGHLARRFRPDLVVSMFLGAYDLDAGRYGGWLPGSRAVAAGADLVWTHSRSNLPRLRDLGVPEHRTHCVYRGVDLRTFPFAPLDERAPGMVVAVGRLIELKGLDDALRVLERVAADGLDARLDVLGEGPELGELRALATSLGVADRVTFHGHVTSAAIAKRLRRASAFLLMSRHDRLPNVVKEAMASGCPCVVTHTQGMPELVEHARTGYLVDVGDVASAARHLTDVLLRPAAHKAMAERAREHIVERFSAEVSMGVYVEAWRATLPVAHARASRLGHTAVDATLTERSGASDGGD